MGLFGKIKGIFYDEIEEDEPIEEVSKVDKIVRRHEIEEKEEEPKVERIKVRSIEEIEEAEEPRIEKKIKNENTFSDRELFRSERTFNFTEFDDEDELPPKGNILDKEVRINNNLDIKTSVPEQRVFKPTPVISPIYGILDKDYKKEEIKTGNNSNNKMNSKTTNYDTVRRKAYGTLEDELEDTLNSMNRITTNVINDEMKSIEKETKKVSKVSKIEDLINKIDDATEELDKTMSIGELEDNVRLENFNDDEEIDKTVSDNTLEHDLFNLIDSMYDKED